jgi:hypothetical protein
MSVSQFPRFSVFFANIQVLQCAFLIFHLFQCFSLYIHPTVCVSHFPLFSVFSPYSRSYRVHFSFSNFFSVSHHIPGHTVFVTLFSVFCQNLEHTVFLIFQVFQLFSPYFTSYNLCFSFSVISVFSPYSRSYSVHFSFCKFLSVFHFPWCSVFSLNSRT